MHRAPPVTRKYVVPLTTPPTDVTVELSFFQLLSLPTGLQCRPSPHCFLLPLPCAPISTFSIPCPRSAFFCGPLRHSRKAKHSPCREIWRNLSMNRQWCCTVASPPSAWLRIHN